MISKLCLARVSFRASLYHYVSVSENLTHVQSSSLHHLYNYVTHIDRKRKSLL